MLRREGMEATLVGGGAIEFYAPDAHSTSDLDLIVSGRSRQELDACLTQSGFDRNGRHWVRGEFFIEVPGSEMPDPVEMISAEGLMLRVVRREVVLADRIIGFKHWRATGYGAQAIALLDAMGPLVDDDMLRVRLRTEGAEDALDALQALSMTGAPITDDRLRAVLDLITARPPRRGDS